MDIEAKKKNFEAIKGGKDVDQSLSLSRDVLPKSLFKYYRPDDNAINSLKEA